VTAYWINTFTAIRDADKLAAYVALSGPAIRAAGGEFLARGVPAEVFEGGQKTRSALVRFPSVEAAVAAYHSPGYQEALVALGDGADRDIRIVPAVDAS
jgi:uncharacterized protein (DUF1330 family)